MSVGMSMLSKLLPQEWRKLLAESIGTFALVFMGAGAIITNGITDNGVGLLGIALAHGLTLVFVICAFGHISGAHINPAVTLGFVVARRISVSLGIAYAAAQLLGGILGALVLALLMPDSFVTASNVGATLISPQVSIGQALLIEGVLTFFLALTVFGAAVHPAASKSIAAFAIGSVLIAEILVAGPLTGASMNPARSLGPALVSGAWADNWVYWVAPAIGGLFAGLVAEYLFIRGHSD